MSVPHVPEPVWVCSNETLRQHCQGWLSEPWLALDTEFVRVSTFYPQAGLLQVADSHSCYLIDPLLITDWQPLAQVFRCTDVIKVFHACAEDLEVCRRLTGELPEPLVDSQMAASLAGMGGSLGFQKLVGLLLGIELAKEETRSNWLQRPLSDEQVRYAVADVFYLHQLYPLLDKALTDMGRRHWLTEDCQRLLADFGQTDNPADYYRRVKLAWRLRPQEQYVLQQVAIWREQQARERDVPRSKVIDDNSLWNMARYKPSNREQLARAGLRHEVLRHDAPELLKIIRNALAAPADQWPRILDTPLSPEAGLWLKQTKEVVASRATALNIPPEILARKKALEALIRSGDNGQWCLPESLAGWRQEQIGEPLLVLLAELSKQPYVESES
ncbi:ribonuclease D [Parathalassolituus penaei]|uniref:Ribonuclease D n=1 Tax=Parathalassolituus penaei TaxID=2997323 RepID=A0A9X3EGF3_9GAMM|nr:ribonuclease D [Parathalassolituus penaei]MCY0966761.1 ribonuclease D [Parathalassolituus penaei]